ncbi:PKD-like family lipoprotein [Chitinophagaceae bacterium 26-R-25]|nr:PKD-like family lipoprotein [Chitinophagaceae bacterium 26-R-25]
MLLSIISCKKDIGNYAYHDVNQIKIAKIDTVVASLGGVLKINPVVSFTQDTSGDGSRYRYEWAYYSISGSSTPTVLDTTKNLNKAFSLPPATYSCYYKVTDKHTGIMSYVTFGLIIQATPYREGWMLMTSVNGSARLDMLYKQSDGTFGVVNNLLDSVHSDLHLAGKPKLVYCYQAYPQTVTTPVYGIPFGYEIYVGTDQSTERVNPETYGWNPVYSAKNEIFGSSVPSDLYLLGVKRAFSGTSNAISISNNMDVRYFDYTGQIRFGEIMNFDTAAGAKKRYSVAPITGFAEGTGSNGFLFYDTDNRRFVEGKLGSTASSVLVPLKDVATVANRLFSYTNTGMDMIYMGYGAVATPTAKYINIVLKNPTTPTYYYAVIDALNYATTQKVYKDITSIATDIDKASCFAASIVNGAFYYAAGSKVYQITWTGGSAGVSGTPAVKLVVDKSGTGEVITNLMVHQYANSLKYTDKYLMVCSYDPAKPEGANGKIECFSEPALITGSLTLATTYSGFGRVVSMDYRER